MRVWDIDPSLLCRQHLLGEHREIHAIWNILLFNLKGYSNHPETLRWKGRLSALYIRHGQVMEEMLKRGYKHNSRLSVKWNTDLGEASAPTPIISEQEQLIKLAKKCKPCRERTKAEIPDLFSNEASND